MKVKVTKSNPYSNQEGIDSLIGKEYDVKVKHETGDVSISSFDWDGEEGLIILNVGEFEVVEP